MSRKQERQGTLRFGAPRERKMPWRYCFLDILRSPKDATILFKKIQAKPGSVAFGVGNVAPNSSDSCLKLKGAKIMRLKVGASKWAENVGRQALLRFWGGRTS